MYMYKEALGKIFSKIDEKKGFSEAISREKTYAVCRRCEHYEEVNKEFFAKILGGAVAAFGFKAWIAFLFAGTGFAFAICVAIIAGGVAIAAFSKEISEWLSKRYECPSCHNKSWEIVTGEELILRHHNMDKDKTIDGLKNEKEFFEKKIEEIEEGRRLLEMKLKEVRNNHPDQFNKKKAFFKKTFKNIKNNDAIDFLTTGEVFFEFGNKVVEGDYSAIVLEYVKSVQTLLLEVLKKRRIYNKGDEKLSLNGIIKKYDAQWDTEIKEKIKEIREMRNPAAHKNMTAKKEAEKIRRIVLGGGDNGIEKSGLISYINMLLL